MCGRHLSITEVFSMLRCFSETLCFSETFFKCDEPLTELWCNVIWNVPRSLLSMWCCLRLLQSLCLSIHTQTWNLQSRVHEFSDIMQCWSSVVSALSNVKRKTSCLSSVHVHVSFCDGIFTSQVRWVGGCMCYESTGLWIFHPPTHLKKFTILTGWEDGCQMQTNQKWKTQPYGSCNPNPTKWENCSIDTPFLRRKKIRDKWIMDVCAFVSCHLFAVWCFWFWQWCSLNKRFGVDVSWATQIWIRSFSVVYMFYECDNSIRRFWLHRM